VDQTTIDRAGLDVTVGKRTIHVEEAGRGEPVVVLHHSTGPFWTPFYDRLAGAHRVVAPDLPGYLRSDRPEMARHPRDLAIGVSQLAAAMDLGPFHLVGFGLGGWVAAELATMAPAQLVSLTLVGADGIRPTSGEIADTMLISHTDQGKLGFSTDQAFVEVFGDEPDPALLQMWDRSREMTARVTWRPWMWSLQLPDVLPGVQVPALVVVGDKDRVVPPNCAEQYAALLPHARLVTMPDAGHTIEVEFPNDLADLVGEFISANKGK